MEEADLALLTEFRISYESAYREVVEILNEHIHLELSGRIAKTTESIVDKLRRQSIRLNRIQDIAGCRLLVSDLNQQDQVVESICTLFPGASVVDRRAKPSHNYRAVHVIVSRSGKTVEIQVRTGLQQWWARYSEKLSDVVDSRIKYGGGDEVIQRRLAVVSDMAFDLEILEAVARRGNDTMLQSLISRLKREFIQVLEGLVADLDQSEGEKP